MHDDQHDEDYLVDWGSATDDDALPPLPLPADSK